MKALSFDDIEQLNLFLATKKPEEIISIHYAILPIEGYVMQHNILVIFKL